jgi:PIN domain nuclease of toxin-antitoxin system
MNLLLDTCTFLWVLSGASELSPRAANLIRAPENDVFFSSASAWEIAIKYSRGHLVLPERPERFVPQARDAHGISPLSIDEESALHVTRLPSLHRDPFDRILVGQAIVHGLAIVTPDPLITQYPVRTIW